MSHNPLIVAHPPDAYVVWCKVCGWQSEPAAHPGFLRHQRDEHASLDASSPSLFDPAS